MKSILRLQKKADHLQEQKQKYLKRQKKKVIEHLNNHFELFMARPEQNGCQEGRNHLLYWLRLT
jgi:hypothetical protein